MELDQRSRYLWRGMPSSEGAVLHQSVWVDLGPCSPGAFSNLDWAGSRVNEVDAGVDCWFEPGPVSLEPSAWFYAYPGVPDSPPTVELSLRAAWAPLDGVELFQAHSLDVGSARGGWSSQTGLGLATYWGRAEPSLALSLGWANAAFNAWYLDLDRASFSYGEAEASVGLAVGGPLTLTPHATADLLLDPRVAEAVGRRTLFDAGLALTVEY